MSGSPSGVNGMTPDQVRTGGRSASTGSTVGSARSLAMAFIRKTSIERAMAPISSFAAWPRTRSSSRPPTMAFIAALAVLFETVPVLRGGAGNVIYFFLWSALLAVPLVNKIEWADLSFLQPVQASMTKPLLLVYPEYKGGFSVSVGGAGTQRGSFVWEGMEWTPERIAMRAGWFGYAFLLVALASLLFDRFDSANPAQSGVKAGRSRGKRWELPLGRITFRSRFLQLTLAELRLAVQGLAWWWYAGAVGLIVATLLTPIDVMRAYLLPGLFLWPVLLWSGMGVRESLHRTGQVVFASPGILRRQFPAMLLSGIVLAVVLSAGAAFRLALENEWGALIGLAISCVLVPSAALAFGTWTGSGRTFEAVYTIAWYIGPMQHVPEIDYLGVSPTAVAAGTAPVMAVAAVVFAVAAYVGRRRQILAL